MHASLAQLQQAAAVAESEQQAAAAAESEAGTPWYPPWQLEHEGFRKVHRHRRRRQQRYLRC